MDDASDAETASLLRSWVANDSRFELTRFDQNVGYLDAVNFGIEQGSARFVLLVNSDTEPRESALERLQYTFDSDERIGIIGAISTWANWSRVPFPYGSDFRRLGEFIERGAGQESSVADLYNASGFFLALRRSMLQRLGLFDADFRPGYYEETDMCLRALDAGYRVVIDRGLYVFHVGHASFGRDARNVHMAKNRERFEARWGSRLEELHTRFELECPLADVIGALEQHDFASEPVRASSAGAITFVATASRVERSALEMIDGLLRKNVDARLVCLGDESELALTSFAPFGYRPAFIAEDEPLPACHGCLVALDSRALEILARGDRGSGVFLAGSGEREWLESDVRLHRELRALTNVDEVVTADRALGAAFRGYGLPVTEVVGGSADIMRVLQRRALASRPRLDFSGTGD